MKINDVYTITGRDTIIKYGNIFYQYDSAKKSLETFDNTNSNLVYLRNTIDIPLSDLTVPQDGSELDKLINDPNENTTLLNVNNIALYIKLHFLEEHSNCFVVIKTHNQFIKVKIHNKRIIKYEEVKELKNCFPIKSFAFYKTRNQYKEASCYLCL